MSCIVAKRNNKSGHFSFLRKKTHGPLTELQKAEPNPTLKTFDFNHQLYFVMSRLKSKDLYC